MQCWDASDQRAIRLRLSLCRNPAPLCFECHRYDKSSIPTADYSNQRTTLSRLYVALSGELLRCVDSACPLVGVHHSQRADTCRRRVSVPVDEVFANAWSYTVHGIG